MIGDANFITILDELKEIHNRYPTMRFGQVLQVALDTKKFGHNINLNDYSSKDILRCLRKFYKLDKLPIVERKFKEDNYKKRLMDIDGIGEKTVKDIFSIYETKQELKDAFKFKQHIPLRDEIVVKLKKEFNIKEENKNDISNK